MNKTTSVAVLLAILTVCGGCATMGGGPSAEEQVRGMLAEWKAALEKQDIDAIMRHYSDDYRGPNGGDKEQVREFIEGARMQGYLDGLETDIENAGVTVDGDTATVTPIIFMSSFGEMGLTADLKKEPGGQWRIVGGEQAY